jgi:hypothetical protein
LVLSASTALAEIPNFSFVGLDGVGDLDGKLNARLGTTSNADEHIINIEDCSLYSGGVIEVTLSVNPLPTGDWQYAAAYAPPGKTCDTSDVNPEAVEGQCYVPAAQRELTSSTVRFEVDLDELIGSECDAASEGEASVYLILQEPTLASVKFERIIFDIDLRAPTAPSLDTVNGGDARFEASWTDETNDTETEYVLYWSDAPFTADDLASVDAKEGLTAKSVAVDTNIDNDVTYYVSVAARDHADNESGLSEQRSVIPAATTDFWESYVAAGGKDPGGFCFIATVSYGSPLEADLGTLRHFRDNVLMSSEAGRWFVDAYYTNGRFIAAWIADKPALKAVTRVMLVPVVWLAEVVLALGPVGALGALLALIAGLVKIRQVRRGESLLIAQELR